MSEDSKASSTTVIGPTILIRGKLRSGEDLVIRGRVEAEISSSKDLLLENSGIIRANANVRSARLSGVLLGNLTADSKVEIALDGRMVGDILAPRIVISDGAAFRGKIDMQDFERPAQSRTAEGVSTSPPPQPPAPPTLLVAPEAAELPAPEPPDKPKKRRFF